MELLPILKAVKAEGAPLLIVADTIESEVMSMLVMNRLQVGLQVCCIKAPSYGEYRKAVYRDIAMLTNGQVVSQDTGVTFEDAIPRDDKPVLGLAKSVSVSKDATIIVGCGDNKAELDEYIRGLKSQIDSCKDEFEVKKMSERYARLTSGIGKINVCAATELELAELKDRCEDSHCAARAAIAEGIVPGGGAALLLAKRELEGWREKNTFGDVTSDEAIGINILIDSLEAPIRRILENAGVDSSYVVSKLLESDTVPNAGYNVLTGKITDMVSEGIIDPCAVECSAVRNAASVAGLLLTSSSCVVRNPEQKKNPSLGAA
jgi:chaperonin GroEL